MTTGDKQEAASELELEGGSDIALAAGVDTDRTDLPGNLSGWPAQRSGLIRRSLASIGVGLALTAGLVAVPAEQAQAAKAHRVSRCYAKAVRWPATKVGDVRMRVDYRHDDFCHRPFPTEMVWGGFAPFPRGVRVSWLLG